MITITMIISFIHWVIYAYKYKFLGRFNLDWNLETQIEDKNDCIKEECLEFLAKMLMFGLSAL